MGSVVYPGYRNGFPFVLGKWEDVTEVDDRSVYPVKISRARASMWWWRVRQWLMEWEVWDAGNYGVEASGYKIVESTRVCEADGAVASKDGWVDIEHSWPYDDVQIYPSFYLNSGGKLDDGEVRLRPWVGFTVNGPPTFQSMMTWADGYEMTEQTSVNCTVDGFHVPIYCDQVPAGQGWTRTTNLLIYPWKYWTFDGLYDEDTGELV